MSAGLHRLRYVGNFADDVNFFDMGVLFNTDGDPVDETTINVGNLGTNYSLQWLGYFFAPESGDYRFRTASDDGSYLWIGDNAVSGFTVGNADVDNGGNHGVITVTSAFIPLVEGTHYPIRIQYGQGGFGASIVVSFEVPSNPGVFTTDGTNYYVSESVTTISGGASSSVGVGVTGDDGLLVAGNDGNISIGRRYPSNNFMGIYMQDGDITTNGYTAVSRSTDLNLYLNVRSGFEMQFRMGNGSGGPGGQMVMATNGTFTIQGNLTKGSGSFDIPHPLLDGKRLIHSFVEAPRCDLIYRGSKDLINGTCTVNLDTDCVGSGVTGMTDGTFVALCRDPVCYCRINGSFNQVRGTVSGNILTIICEDNSSNETVDWMVIAERHDDFIKQWSKTDTDGRLILEHDEVVSSGGA